MNGLIISICLLQPVSKRIETLPITAFNLSGDGQTVVGRIVHELGISDEPCYWTKASGTKPLDRGSYQWGTAYGVSHDGSRIVGLVSRGKEQYVALWEKAGKLQVIAPWEGHWDNHGHFPSISGDGRWIVGSSQSLPFRWSKASGILFLKPINPKLPRGTAAAASYDGSTIVGGSEAPREAGNQTGLLACIWGKEAVPSLLQVGRYPEISLACVSDDGLTAAGNAHAEVGGVPFVWTKREGVKMLTELTNYTTNVWGMSPDGSLIFGYSSPTVKEKPWVGTVWKNRKPMSTESFLASLNVDVPKGWKTGQLRASSRNGAVIIGDGETPDGKFTSWIVR